MEKGLTVIALPHAEEVSDTPSDTGSPVEVLREEFGVKVDFDHLKNAWYKHEGEFAIDPKAVNARATSLRKWIKARPEKEIAMVSHGFFSHFLTGDVDDHGQQTTPWWNEAELRTYKFVEGDDKMARIEETQESLASRGGVGEGGHYGLTIVNDPAQRGK